MVTKKVLIVLAMLGLFSGFAQATEKYEVVKVWPEAPQGWHFRMTWAVTIDNAGNVYVGDTANYRVKKFDSEGRLLTQWGSPGKGDGQFKSIRSIKVDSSGMVYVVDLDRGKWEHCRIQKFTPYGQFIGIFERTAPEAGKFELPVDVAVGPRGNVFVLAVDYAPAKKPPCPVRVEKYSPQGDFLTQWGSAGSGDGQFAHPQAIAVDTQGNVYVADEWNHRIQKFSSEGNFLLKWGGQGQTDGLFNKPRSIAFDKLGEVYVVDRHSVQKFTPAGKFLAKWNVKGEGQQPWQVAVHDSGHVYVTDIFSDKVLKFDTEGNVVSQWGSAGSGDGQFSAPEGIAVNASGSVFVADVRNDRIQKFDSQGKFLTKWGSGYWCGIGTVGADASGNVYATDIGVHEVQKFNADGKLVARWGTEGSGDGQFHEPYGIAVGPSGNVYVADTANCRVQKFTCDGKFLTKWGTRGAGDGQFIVPEYIAVDGLGNVWVGDKHGPAKHRIQKFDPNGKFLGKWTTAFGVDAIDFLGNAYRVSAGAIEKYDPNGQLIARFGKDDSNEENPGYVYSMCVDPSGYLYASDHDGSIRKFDSKGNFVSKWTTEGVEGQEKFPAGPNYCIAVDGAGNVYVFQWAGTSIWKLSSDGKLGAIFQMEPPAPEGRFLKPGGVAVDDSGNVYVVDSVHINWGSPSIQKFESNGKFIVRWKGSETGKGEFKYPVSVAVDSSGNTYVTDKGSDCVHKFDPQGKFIKSWGSKGKENGQFDSPEGIAVDKSGNVYVCDRQNSRIQKFDSNGKFLAQWGKEGSGDGEFHFPAAVALDKEGNVYIADTDNHRIQKFSPQGKFLTEWGEFGEAPGQLSVPSGIAVDASGNVYVSDNHNHRIQKFAPVSCR